VRNINSILYKTFASFALYYLLATMKKDEWRHQKIYPEVSNYLNSSLYIFVSGIVVTIVSVLVLENPLIAIAAPLFGLHPILTFLLTYRERTLYWEWKERQAEEKRKIREKVAKMRAERERLRQEEARKEFYRQQYRNNNSKQQSQSSNVSGYQKHLATLNLPTDCKDFNLIKKQYRKMAKQFHPDVNKSANASKKLNEIMFAYRELEKTYGK